MSASGPSGPLVYIVNFFENRNTIRVSNSMDPDQTRQLQKLSADDTRRQSNTQPHVKINGKEVNFNIWLGVN